MAGQTVRVVVPRRGDDGRRDLLWAFCAQWWEALPWPVTEGHHLDGPFNRAAAINGAANEAGPWDVLVVLDGDVVADVSQVVAAVERAHETGRLCFAFDRFVSLNEPMTERVLAGYDGNWAPGAKLKMSAHVSSALAIPAGLWDATGGFDERFEGWGHEDVAFAHSARVLGGGIDRVPGTVWHLWHGPIRKASSAHRASPLLAQHYFDQTTPGGMAALVDRRLTADAVLAVVTTHGRRDCIAAAIPSLEANLVGLPIVRRVISDDSGDIDYRAWLQVRFPGWEITSPRNAPAGFGANVAHAWDVALGSGEPWVFWAEDDFTYDRPVDLAAMARVLAANPHLAQMALRRQAWFPDEIAAGGVVEQHPDAYLDHCDGAHEWLEHQLFWTTNPSLIPRRTLADHAWPNRPHSEAVFGRQVLRGDTRAGYWGPRSGTWVTHLGERTGKGY